VTSLVSIFATAILPIIAIAAVGFALGRTKDVEPGPLNTAVVYVLAPALVFHSLATTRLSGDTLARVVLGVVVYTVVMIVIAEGIGRALGGS
jgi:predicted permease